MAKRNMASDDSAVSRVRISLRDGLLSYAIVLVVVLVAGSLWSGAVGLMVGVIALLVTIVTTTMRSEGTAPFVASLSACALAVGSGGLAADQFNAYRAAVATPVLEDASAHDPAAANAGAMVFRTASVRADLAATRTYTYVKPKSGTKESYALTAAPVVDATWNRSQPVLLWAVCRAHTVDNCPGWPSRSRGAMAVDSTKRDDYAEVIAHAANRHKLAIATTPVPVILTEDPRAAAADLKRNALLALGGFLAAWLVGFAVTWGGVLLVQIRKDATR